MKAALRRHLWPRLHPFTQGVANNRKTHRQVVGAFTFTFHFYPFVGSPAFHKSRAMVAGAVSGASAKPYLYPSLDSVKSQLCSLGAPNHLHSHLPQYNSPQFPKSRPFSAGAAWLY